MTQLEKAVVDAARKSVRAMRAFHAFTPTRDRASVAQDHALCEASIEADRHLMEAACALVDAEPQPVPDAEMR